MRPRRRAPSLPNALLRLTPAGVVTVVVGRVEMGQGATTGLAMALAEELDCDWQRVVVEQAYPDKAFRNPLFWNLQVTGISTSLRQGWRPMREAGARARAMLVAAAATRWGVTVASCRTEAGMVYHDPTGRSLEYGALVAAAAEMPVPREAPLKDPREFRLIGRRLDRLDGEAKVRGSTTYGIDVRVPDMVYASVERCPVAGGQVGSVAGEAGAMAVPGVLKVVRLPGPGGRGGGALLAGGEGAPGARHHLGRGGERLDFLGWRRRGAHRAARIGEGARSRSTRATPSGAAGGGYDRHCALRSPISRARNDGAAELHRLGARRARGGLGPDAVPGGTVLRGRRRRAWRGGHRGGLSTSDVTLHTTFLGGGFGRRLEVDYVEEAARIARELDRPVQVIWSREDDMRHDFFRPVAAHALTAALGADGLPVAWRQRVATPSVARHWVPWIPAWALNLGGVFEHGADIVALEGSLVLPYAVPNRLLDWRELEVPVPVGFWRSVGHSHNTFAVESFVDELAHAAGRDPVAYRQALLRERPAHRRGARAGGGAIGVGHPAAGRPRARRGAPPGLRQRRGAGGRGVGVGAGQSGCTG